MSKLYSILFALSIVLINPWGQMRGEIWTFPKVFIVFVVTFSNAIFSLESCLTTETVPKPSRNWCVQLLLWAIFLTCGLISTLKSPFPWVSFVGQEQMGDGWFYWLLLAVFTLSNTLLLQRYPELFFSQCQGILLGGLLLSLSIVPQVFDWRIDYTITSGEVLQSNVLASTIFQNQQPIGLYSHRGHAAFVLAVAGTLGLLLWKLRYFSRRRTFVFLLPIVLALFFTQTRMGILAFLGSSSYLLGRGMKRFVPAILVAAIALSSWTTWRQINHLSPLNQAASGRLGMWEQAIRGIQMRPVWGWGFDGHGIAYPYTDRWHQKPIRVLALDAVSFTGEFATGKNARRPLPSYKAHNLILDLLQSVGIVGLCSYLALVGSYGWDGRKASDWPMEAVAIAYFLFTLTWFDCAQYGHLLWWSFSARGSINRSMTCPL